MSARPAPAKPDAAVESETAAKLAIALRSFSLAQREADGLRASNEKLAADKATLEASVHSLGALQAENERLKSATKADASETAALRDKVSGLEQQFAASRAEVAAKSAVIAAAKPDTTAETETAAKLATALRGYSLAQADLDGLKAANEKLAAEKSSLEQQLAASKSAVPIASQAQALREQVRQAQAQVAALAEENARLKNQLVASTAPRATPARPGVSAPGESSRGVAAAPTAAIAAASPPSAARAAPPAAAARTHTIVAGDTLIRISLNYYGTPNRWSDILAANGDVLRDERSLVIGRVIHIP